MRFRATSFIFCGIFQQMIFLCLSHNSFFCSLEIVQQDLFLLDEKDEAKQKKIVIPSEIGKIRNRDFSIQERKKNNENRKTYFIQCASDDAFESSQ